MQPLVSILIPVYNHALYIEDCLNALRDLEYPNIELLICDDGSIDDSYSIAFNWVQMNPSISSKLFKQQNKGVCKTLNRLIRESAGEYITLCASDDLLGVDSLGPRVKLLEIDGSKLACIGDAILVNEYSEELAVSAMKSLFKASYKNLLGDIVSELVVRWSVVGPTLLIRRTAYDIYGLYDESLTIEDREFYLRLLAANTLVFYPHTVASYRIHSSNISRMNISARLNIFEQVAIANIRHAEAFSGICRWFLHSHKVDAYLIKKSKTKALYFLLQALRTGRKMLFFSALYLRKYK